MHHVTCYSCSAIIPRRRPAGLRVRLTARAVGQGLVEYAILLIFIAIVVIGGVTMFGMKTSGMYQKTDCAFDKTQPGCPASLNTGGASFGATFLGDGSASG